MQPSVFSARNVNKKRNAYKNYCSFIQVFKIHLFDYMILTLLFSL